jgi:hypothetical protein
VKQYLPLSYYREEVSDLDPFSFGKKPLAVIYGEDNICKSINYVSEQYVFEGNMRAEFGLAAIQMPWGEGLEKERYSDYAKFPYVKGGFRHVMLLRKDAAIRMFITRDADSPHSAIGLAFAESDKINECNSKYGICRHNSFIYSASPDDAGVKYSHYNIRIFDEYCYASIVELCDKGLSDVNGGLYIRIPSVSDGFLLLEDLDSDDIVQIVKNSVGWISEESKTRFMIDMLI